MGGQLLGRLWPRDDGERSAALDAGYDLDRILTADDLCSGEDVFFSASGVTDGDVLQGVRYRGPGASTESLVMRSRSGTVRRVHARHDRASCARSSASATAELGGAVRVASLDEGKERRMDVGVALPNAVPGATGAQLTEWARRAEARGFSSLGTIDRVVYDNYEPLIALARAAAVTERIGLATTVLLGPLRTNTVELAKQARASSALRRSPHPGIGLGARDDDYEASGVELRGRGKRLDAMLEEIEGDLGRRRDRPDDRGRAPPDRRRSRRRLLRPRRALRRRLDRRRLGPRPGSRGRREGEGRLARGRPRGPAAHHGARLLLARRPAEEDVRENLMDYYAWLGEDVARMIGDSAAKDA